MFIIKNRVNGEYDRRGSYDTFHKVKRGAWDKIGHAKNHVSMRVLDCRVDHNALTWYLDADFIEMDETGIKSVIPVSEYLKKYFSDSWRIKWLTNDEKTKLGLEISND